MLCDVCKWDDGKKKDDRGWAYVCPICIQRHRQEHMEMIEQEIERLKEQKEYLGQKQKAISVETFGVKAVENLRTIAEELNEAYWGIEIICDKEYTKKVQNIISANENGYSEGVEAKRAKDALNILKCGFTQNQLLHILKNKIDTVCSVDEMVRLYIHGGT